MTRNEIISAGIRLIGVYIFVQGILILPNFASVALTLLFTAFSQQFSFAGVLSMFATGVLISGLTLFLHLILGWYLMGGAKKVFERATAEPAK